MDDRRAARRPAAAVVAIVGLLLAASARRVAAEGILRDGIGPIPAGRGAANVAHSDNIGVLLENPAGLGNMEAHSCLAGELGEYIFAYDYADRENRDASGSGSLLPLADAAYLTHVDALPDLAYGLGVFVPGGFGTNYRLKTPAAFGGTTKRYRSFAALVKVIGGVAYRVTDRLTIGGHAGVAGVHARLRSPYYVQTGVLRGLPVIVNVRGTGVAPAWALGAQYRLTDSTMLGTSYTAENDFSLGTHGLADVALGSARGRYRASTELSFPRAVVAGIRQDVGERHRVSLDGTWRDWSDAFDDIRFKLTKGRGLPVKKLNDTVQLQWNDGYAVAAGYEFLWTKRTALRGGYTYHPSPVPDDRLTPLITATFEHVFSVGVGFPLEPFELDMSYQYTFGPVRRSTRSAFVGGDFAHSRSQVSGNVVSVAIARLW